MCVCFIRPARVCVFDWNHRNEFFRFLQTRWWLTNNQKWHSRNSSCCDCECCCRVRCDSISRWVGIQPLSAMTPHPFSGELLKILITLMGIFRFFDCLWHATPSLWSKPCCCCHTWSVKGNKTRERKKKEVYTHFVANSRGLGRDWTDLSK